MNGKVIALAFFFPVAVAADQNLTEQQQQCIKRVEALMSKKSFDLRDENKAQKLVEILDECSSGKEKAYEKDLQLLRDTALITTDFGVEQKCMHAYVVHSLDDINNKASASSAQLRKQELRRDIAALKMANQEKRKEKASEIDAQEKASTKKVSLEKPTTVDIINGLKRRLSL